MSRWMEDTSSSAAERTGPGAFHFLILICEIACPTCARAGCTDPAKGEFAAGVWAITGEQADARRTTEVQQRERISPGRCCRGACGCMHLRSAAVAVTRCCEAECSG